MLKLELAQLERIDQVREDDYLKQVALEVRRIYPHLLEGVEQPKLMDYLAEAYASAQEFGLSERGMIGQYLYFSIVHPRFFANEGFVKWMQRDYDSPEQRFRDFRAILLFTIQQRIHALEEE